MTSALRQLVAEFTVKVDSAGAMKRGEAGINQLKSRFQQLDATVAKTSATTGGFFSRIGSAVNASSTGIGRGIGGFARAVTSLQVGLAALAGGVVGSQIKSLVDTIGGIGEEAAKLGVTNAEFQRLDVLAKQNATSVQSLGTAFRTIGKAAVDPTKETTSAFQRLGVAVKNTDGTFRGRNDLFFDSAMALADISNESERATLAQQLYGRSAIELLPLLSQGSDGIRAQRAELEKLPVVSDSAIAAADQLGDRWPGTMLRLKAVAGDVLERIVLPLLEALTTTVELVADAFGKLLKIFNPMTIGLAALVVGLSPLVSQFRLLVALGGGWGALTKNVVRGAGAMAKALGPAVLAFLLLEDIFVFFSGGKSLIGRGLEKAFGPGLKKTIDDIRDAVKDLWGWLSGEKTDLGKFKSLVEEIGLAIRLMINDALAMLPGSGRTAGLTGLNQYERNQDRKTAYTRELKGTEDPFLRGDFGGSNLLPLPPGAGPPAAGAGAGPTVQANGDRNVTINMLPGTSPTAIGAEVGRVLERDRNSDLANVR